MSSSQDRKKGDKNCMSKLITEGVYLRNLPNNKIAVSFITSNQRNAMLFKSELEKYSLIEVSARVHKETRSVRQNKMLWAVISRISDEINGEHTTDSIMKIYGDLLMKANVRYDFLFAKDETLDLLRNSFRAIIPTGEEQLIDGHILKMYKVFEGSSQFTTKEFIEFMDIVFDYASLLGIIDSEIEAIKETYK